MNTLSFLHVTLILIYSIARHRRPPPPYFPPKLDFDIIE